MILRPPDVAALVVAVACGLRDPPPAAEHDVRRPEPPLEPVQRGRLRALARTLYEGLAPAERRWVRERCAARVGV